MQLSPAECLPLMEETRKLCFLDIEATGLKADYNSILVASVKPWGASPRTLSVDVPGNDKRLVKELRDVLEEYLVWVTYYGKSFDIPMIRSRLLHHRMKDLVGRFHLDMYYMLKSHTLTARRSQAHLIEWLGTPAKKLTLSPEVWNTVLTHPKRGLATLRHRCEQDVRGLEGLYDRSKHLAKDITR